MTVLNSPNTKLTSRLLIIHCLTFPWFQTNLHLTHDRRHQHFYILLTYLKFSIPDTVPRNPKSHPLKTQLNALNITQSKPPNPPRHHPQTPPAHAPAMPLVDPVTTSSSGADDWKTKLLGKTLSTSHTPTTFAKSDLPKECRVLNEGDMKTMDYKPGRLNVQLGSDGVVRDVNHG
jgi:hypothetical protein